MSGSHRFITKVTSCAGEKKSELLQFSFASESQAHVFPKTLETNSIKRI